jgi:hypothetical protein
MRMPSRIGFRLFAAAAVALPLILAACGGGRDSDGSSAAQQPPIDASSDAFLAGRPQSRPGIGDVDRAFRRFETTRGDLITFIQDQAWYEDGLDDAEALFVERALSFVAGRTGGSFESLNQASVRDKLFLHDRVKLGARTIDLLLIYEPGQDAEREMSLLRALLPVLERLVGVQFPEAALTVVNGNYPINDFNPGGFVRIARCCVLSPFVLAHELAHSYWSMGSSWFNEGMADIYATLALEELDRAPPAGWRGFSADIDSFYAARKRMVQSGRFPELTLPRRFARDGLYEAADVFLLDIRAVIGAEAFAAAARDIYTASDFGRYRLSEKRIEDVFLARAPDGAQEKVMELFNKHIWGDNGDEYQRLREFEGP